ncbi:tripartite tricarboxylate transporter substrate-binding protein [Phytoactinopolyspora limicola]|uniref:tripartite tricarboxylate transporter substrate-binding protein n=1 Tax=Phytoactinopolyspora limicola TaxID=2715536 RepID=UPI00140B4EBE|nr:tripartite tricarboxylate transporter substrate-binding protein [Phytoactinopolyspora limicola]
MRPPRRLSWLLASLSACALVLAACGGDDADSPADDPQAEGDADPADTDDTDSADDADDDGPAAGGDVDFPTGTVRILVGSGPGSGMDFLARGLAPRLQELWGESVVVENVPGANQSAAYHEAANSDPDGHTLFIGVEGTFGIHDQLGTIDPGWAEFEWFGTLTEGPWAFHVDANGPIETFEDLLAAEPLRYGDGGYESPVNLVALTFFDAFGLDFIFTPGYDPGQAQSGVLTGEQHFVAREVEQFVRYDQGDDYTPIVIAAGDPHPDFPNAKTFDELADEYGVEFPGEMIFQLGLNIGTTPGTPPEVVDYLADSIITLIEEDEPFQEWRRENLFEETMLVENIGREVTSQKVAALSAELAEVGLDDLQERLEAGTGR